jgi:prophage maintenance system killer protein
MADIVFLTLAEVIEIHADQIGRYGGLSGIRDMNLLSSAAAMPAASFGGEYLHADPYEMAAGMHSILRRITHSLTAISVLLLLLRSYSWK